MLFAFGWAQRFEATFALGKDCAGNFIEIPIPVVRGMRMCGGSWLAPFRFGVDGAGAGLHSCASLGSNSASSSGEGRRSKGSGGCLL